MKPSIRTIAALAFVGAFACMSWFGLTTARAADAHTSYFMVASNPTDGREADFVTWYSGQHIHDLLNIPGVKAAQFFKLSNPQYREGQKHPLQYLVICEVDSDHLADVFLRIQNGLATGTTVRSDAMNGPTSTNDTFSPVTKRLTAEDVRGKSVEDVLRMSALGN
jgi:hypothetical protein